MKCPFCGREMTEGFVQAAREVFFTEKRHRFFFNTQSDDVLLSTHKWTAPTAKAWHCSSCMKVIVDYEEAWCKENGR